MTTNNPTSTDWLITDYHQINDHPGGSSLTPKGNLSKPIRRRSRASKKTPTTVLNTSPTNFRALVQQFTGCPSRRPGPVNLSFGAGACIQQDVAVSINNNGSSCSSSTASAAAVHSFDEHQYHHLQNELLSYQQQAQYQLQNDAGFTAAVEATRYAESCNMMGGDQADFGTDDLEEIAGSGAHVLF